MNSFKKILIKNIISKQIKRGVPDKEIAAQLRSSRQLWQLYRNQPQRLFIPPWMTGLLVNFPELLDDLINAIKEGNDDREH